MTTNADIAEPSRRLPEAVEFGVWRWIPLARIGYPEAVEQALGELTSRLRDDAISLRIVAAGALESIGEPAAAAPADRIERLRPGATPVDKCTKCPPPQTNKPFLGLMVAWGLKPDGASWSGGTILDPDSGDTYRCTMKVVDGNTLAVRGYVGISLFGRTQQWKRAN